MFEPHLEYEALVCCLEQFLELLLLTLLCVEQGQHYHVHASHELLVPWILRPGLTQAVVIDDDASAGLHGWYKILEKFDGVRGRVIVEDPSEEVN